MKNNQPAKMITYEFIAFLEFIEKATGWEVLDSPFWFHSENGIEGIINEPVDILVRSYETYYFYDKKTKCSRRAYICLGEHEPEKVIWDKFDSPADINYIKLGPTFITSLIEKNPGLWWLFIASCLENPRIVLDRDGKNLTLTADRLPYIFKHVDVPPKMNVERIDELSEINENDFIYRRKRSKETYVILGNGISIPFGSDLWSQLSDYLFDYLQPQYVENGDLVKKAIGGSTFSTTSICKTIINPQKYADALYSCIYRKYEKTMHSENTLIREIALSKLRDKKLKIISYNYDEFLEIEYNDFCNPPSKIKPVCDEDEDVVTSEPKVLHIHGFISKDKSIKKGLVLTQEEYYRTYSKANWTVTTQEEALKNNCLYVGSSMSDLFQMSIIDKVRKEHFEKALEKRAFGAPWKCYALLCLKGLEPRDIATIYTYYLNKGIRIIFTKEFGELPEKYSKLLS